MNGIYYKVNRKGQYKNYMNGTYTEMKQASDELIARATAKGFKKIRRTSGSCGIILTYSDGKTDVELVYVAFDSEREWLRFYNRQS